jgi:hypothetical protein
MPVSVRSGFRWFIYLGVYVRLYLFILAVLGFELRALCVLGSSLPLNHAPHLLIFNHTTCHNLNSQLVQSLL